MPNRTFRNCISRKIELLFSSFGSFSSCCLFFSHVVHCPSKLFRGISFILSSRRKFLAFILQIFFRSNLNFSRDLIISNQGITIVTILKLNPRVTFAHHMIHMMHHIVTLMRRKMVLVNRKLTLHPHLRLITNRTMVALHQMSYVSLHLWSILDLVLKLGNVTSTECWVKTRNIRHQKRAGVTIDIRHVCFGKRMAKVITPNQSKRGKLKF
mmetsp:Transcript_40465/g.56230  ORF Transcript_40465/g.56230 Transcript_40465/m.56230 type:complete len:211 (+) Transcript_40465:784-1416(+)